MIVWTSGGGRGRRRGGVGCLTMVLVSLLASILLTILLNLMVR
ncbi:MAG: hypothetical protein JWL73_1957 [Actinomycetia bacterium]|nr:hypothetical protein [Actinomycetes bacterium]